MKGTNFTLEQIGKINNDFTNVYEGETVVALIDTDSNYYQIDPIIKKITDNETYAYILSKMDKKLLVKLSKQVKSKEDFLKLAFVMYHDETLVGPIIDKTLRDFEKKYNTTRNLPWDFEGESEIKTQAVWAKKRYIYEAFSGKFTVKGLDIIKTNSSYFIREDIKKILLDLVYNSTRMTHTENNIDYEDKLDELSNKYKGSDIFKISNPVKVGDDQWGKHVHDGILAEKGPTKNIRALYNFNKALDFFGEEYINVPRIHEGKIHVFEINKSNELGIDVIGIPFAINEIIGNKIMDRFQINYQRQWKAKGENIIGSCYEVFRFRQQCRSKQTLHSRLFRS